MTVDYDYEYGTDYNIDFKIDELFRDFEYSQVNENINRLGEEEGNRRAENDISYMNDIQKMELAENEKMNIASEMINHAKQRLKVALYNYYEAKAAESYHDIVTNMLYDHSQYVIERLFKDKKLFHQLITAMGYSNVYAYMDIGIVFDVCKKWLNINNYKKYSARDLYNVFCFLLNNINYRSTNENIEYLKSFNNKKLAEYVLFDYKKLHINNLDYLQRFFTSYNNLNFTSNWLEVVNDIENSQKIINQLSED